MTFPRNRDSHFSHLSHSMQRVERWKGDGTGTRDVRVFRFRLGCGRYLYRPAPLPAAFGTLVEADHCVRPRGIRMHGAKAHRHLVLMALAARSVLVFHDATLCAA